MLLLPKLRSYFAEFLNESSLERLRILSSSTCVGLRYGHPINSLEDFLGRRLDQFMSLRTPHHFSRLTILRIYLKYPSTSLDQHFRSLDGLTAHVPPSLKRLQGGTGIFACFPSPTPFGLGLGSDLPWEELPCPGNLRFTANKFLTCFIATRADISSSNQSRVPYSSPSPLYRTLPYQLAFTNSAASVTSFSPVTSSAQDRLTSELLRTL